mgnify:CR=1 FL=1
MYECSICLIKNNDFFIISPCGHYFHVCCFIDNLFLSKNNNCPLCRTKFETDFIKDKLIMFNIYCKNCLKKYKLCKTCNSKYCDCYNTNKNCFDCKLRHQTKLLENNISRIDNILFKILDY